MIRPVRAKELILRNQKQIRKRKLTKDLHEEKSVRETYASELESALKERRLGTNDREVKQQKSSGNTGEAHEAISPIDELPADSGSKVSEESWDDMVRRLVQERCIMLADFDIPKPENHLESLSVDHFRIGT